MLPDPADQPSEAGPDFHDQYDLVCIGFGPASLAIAIALHDRGIQARVLYIEKQRSFVWHAGMLLPNARMQISFLKDLATLRDPRSKFTFVNYLKSKNRLVAFTNLSTFLPLREEYNDYMSWCASHFKRDVLYGYETLYVAPTESRRGSVQSWQIVSRNLETDKRSIVVARNVVVAIGGKPKIPPTLSASAHNSKVVHSSLYSTAVPRVLTDPHKVYNIAVVGGGQSAAEIYNDLQSRYPNSYITLYTGASALKPSDDSPFVNEVFDPERVDAFYNLPTESRQKSSSSDKATNYGVVRPELLDRIYESMYHQRLHEPDQSRWQHRILAWREVMGFEDCPGSPLRLKLKNTLSGESSTSDSNFDLAILATGYDRNGHETLLEPTRFLLQENRFAVERDYRLMFRKDAVADGCGIWLQGCCEDSHGLSDTLLSILAAKLDVQSSDDLYTSATAPNNELNKALPRPLPLRPQMYITAVSAEPKSPLPQNPYPKHPAQ
ncbi:hypothetical protein MMC13_003701 [Lambiella insularis]|nr:hypothetical protein [Lambiella insularis]